MNYVYKKILEIKHIPRFIKIALILGINWTLQSLLYMDSTEKLFKLMIDFILFLFFSLIFFIFNSLSILTLLLSFTIAHTTNWIFNGHIFSLLKTFNKIRTEKKHFIDYLNGLKARVSNEKSILVVTMFGSISRKELKETSDIDIRIIRKRGFINGIKSCSFVSLERARAFFDGFPLDIYVLDNFKALSKLDEQPLVLYDPEAIVKKLYTKTSYSKKFKGIRKWE